MEEIDKLFDNYFEIHNTKLYKVLSRLPEMQRSIVLNIHISKIAIEFEVSDRTIYKYKKEDERKMRSYKSKEKIPVPLADIILNLLNDEVGSIEEILLFMISTYEQ